jgi:DNA-binding transcriptional LysR family regulator
MIDLVRLRLLRELAHRGTMTAVATALRMTSSAVSQQLATLERETRTILLERVGRRVRFTAEGTRLVAHADRILEATEAAEQDLRAAAKTARGKVEIATFPTFAKAHLLPAIVRARDRFPEIRAIIHELESPDAIEAARDGRCHIAITFAYNLVPRPDVAGLDSQQLLEEPVLLVLPKRWRRERGPFPISRLAEEHWIVGSRQGDDRVLAERACASAGFAPEITHTVDDYDLMIRMVSAGLGVGFVPQLGLRFASTQNIVARTPAGVPLTRRIYAFTRRALSTSPLVRSMLAEILKS